MKFLGFTLAFALVVLTFGGLVSSQDMNKMDKMMGIKVDKATVDQIITGWKPTPQEVARTVIAKYGMPQEATAERLVWHNNGPWKRTELVNEEIPHSFPKQHPDMLKQTISYQVPTDKFDDLAEYDGSVIVERTKGEISARCDKEEANFLALNLADDIVKGKKSVKDARKFYAESVLEMKNPEYMKGFLFQVSNTELGDADKAVMMNNKEMKKNK
ncbi:MAG: hypothetical protein H0X15_10615 [Acidobacteria bacterium]|jgi:hypothetical protein|nr:hypothetical protein [Acidobacteriota bacterium]